MKRLALRLFVAGTVVAVLLLVAGAIALRRIDTPAFRGALVERVSKALGARVRVDKLDMDVLRGVRLEGVSVSNPAPQPGELLTADAVVLKHRLWPLLRGHVVVDSLELKRPVLSLAADARGFFNYERLGGGGRSSSGPSAGPLRVTLERFSIDDGRLSLADATRTVLLRMEKVAVTASVDAAPEALLSDARIRGQLSASGLGGTLVAEAKVERRPPSSPPKGSGEAHVDDCRVERSALFSLLATTLAMPELARPEMDECRVEFRLGGGRVVTPVVSLKGQPVQVTGTGSLVLATGALDYEMQLALATALVERLPAKELRAAFKDRGDGYAVLPFALRGTTARPETDIATRLARAAAGEAAKGKLKSILDKVF